MTDYRFSLQRKTQSFSSLGGTAKTAASASYVVSPATTRATSATSTTNRLLINPTDLVLALPAIPFLNLRPSDLWDRDARYAASARIVDYRQDNCCGGRCRTPYMTFQMWNLGVPCNTESMSKFLFPMDRFVWAHAELRRLLANPPARIDLTNLVPDSPDNNLRFSTAHEVMKRDPEAWSQWCIQIMRCVALARWSTNLRWRFVADMPNSTPNMDSLGFFMNRNQLASPIPRSIEEMRSRYHSSYSKETIDHDVRQLVNPGRNMTLVGLSPYVWDYDQTGIPVDNGTGETTERPARDMPLRPTKIPTSVSDFDPVKSWNSESLWLPPLPPSEILQGVRNSPNPEYMLTSFFSALHDILPSQLNNPSWVFQFTSPQYVWDNGPRFVWDEGSRRSVQKIEVTSVLPSPYVQVLYCAALAQDMVAFDFFTYINKALEQWLVRYEALPEQFRILNPNELRSAMRNLLQAQLDAASNQVSVAGGTIAAIATAINPIAGVVVTLLVAIAALLVRLAADLCIILPDAPPWVYAPFLRFIETGLDGQGACDFQTTGTGGASRIASAHVALIRGMAERGISPDDWFTVLDTIERDSPDIRGDGGGRDGVRGEESILLPVVAAASAVLFILAVAAKKKKKEPTL